MEKKIIGYKMTKPEYVKAAMNIVGSALSNEREFIDFMLTAEDRGHSRILHDAGVLNLWFETIYEEVKELKIEQGKYYYCIKDVIMDTDHSKTYTQGKVYLADYLVGMTDDAGDEHLWSYPEEVYEHFRLATPEEVEEYKRPKVGDWYVCLPGFNNMGSYSTESAKSQKMGGSGWEEGRVFQVDSTTSDDTLLWPKPYSGKGGGIYIHAVRKATLKEIESISTKKLTLGDKDIEVTIGKGFIKADSTNIDIESVKKVWKLTQTTLNTQTEINTGWDIFINTVKVGCTVFTPNELHQIITIYESINK